ncbi:restriction endonuclease [Nonomuraea angiospora]
MTDQGRYSGPPGRPLWLAAERARAAKFGGESKYDFVLNRLKIGRVTYDRLEKNPTRPIIRTVKKIADGIGMPLDEAMHLAGYETAMAGPPDSGVDLVVQGPNGVMLVQVKDFQRQLTEKQIDALREAGEETGRTLGDVLVILGLAEPEELKLTRYNQDYGEDSSTAIGGEAAEAARSRRGPSTT